MSSTGLVTVVVNEVNRPPAILPVIARRIPEGVLFTLPMLATDPDLPANTLTWSLGSAPVGSAINPSSGVFTWTPTILQGPSSNQVQIIVTDNGTPPLSTTQVVTIVVLDSLGDFVVKPGNATILSGETNSVPVTLVAGVDIASLQFNLTTDDSRLTNLTLINPGATVASATLIPSGSNRVSLQFAALSGQTFPAGSALAQLEFNMRTGVHSGFVWLQPINLTGTRSSGAALTNGMGNAGRIVAVDNKPILEVTPGSAPNLLLYAWPGVTYQLETRTNLFDSWNAFIPVNQSNRVSSIVLSNLPAMQFFRAYR
jgi:hypothetical protein